MQRLFFALWPDTPTRERMAHCVESLRTQRPRAGRWTPIERYHLTLQFLGDYAPAPPALIASACKAAELVQVAPFALMLDRAGSFRNRSIPWWLACSDMPVALRRLRDELGAALREASVRYETGREFSPHVTVLRDARDLLPATSVEPVIWGLHEFVLVASHLGGAHSGYTVLRRFPLCA